MDMALEVYPIFLFFASLSVSILVLMDMALEVLTYLVTLSKYKSFNPCFDGYGSGSPGPLIFMHSISLVSILVLMDMALEG